VTVLFMIALLLAGLAGGVGVATVPILVVAVLEIGRGIAVRLGGEGLVPIWEERRAYAVHSIVAALGGEGIRARVRGLGPLVLLQVFGPYASAEILVPETDAARARELVHHWLAGGPPPAADAATGAVVGVSAAAKPRAPRAAVPLAALAVVGLVLAVGGELRKLVPAPPEPDAPPIKLELVYVDDESDPLKAIPDARVPEGITIHREGVPIGPGRYAEVSFARATLAPGESVQAGAQRLKAWLDTVPVDPGKRFALEGVDDYDPDTAQSKVVGVRSYLLSGEALLTEADVEDAGVEIEGYGARRPYVALVFTRDGARRFEDATGAWVQRRMAIMVDGMINSAPVIKTRIAGGRASITMGSAADREKTLADAHRLARSLRGNKKPR
jgi:hypothetical protein